jgi:hypothetical protein
VFRFVRVLCAGSSFLLRAIHSHVSEFLGALEQSALSAGLIVGMGGSIGYTVDRPASHFARAKSLIIIGFGLSAFRLHVEAEFDRRRVASERVGISGWFSAQLTMEARSTGAARNPIMGSRPVAGRPRFFALAFFDI